MGVVDVRAGGVVRANRVAHPLLVPRRVVHAVVVAATARDSDLVELGMEEQGAGRVLPARRAAVAADASDVVEQILLGDRLMPQDAVREAGVLEVLPADI